MTMKFHYPKLALFCIVAVATYFIFSQPAVIGFFSTIGNISYFEVFLGGMLFSFGFTTPFAAALFATIQTENIFLAGIIGGIGATISDLFIFGFVRFSFSDEFERLERTRFAKKVGSAIKHTLGARIKAYLTFVIAGFLIASPLPDETGIILLAGLTKIKPATLAVASFLLNTAGIIVLLSI